MAHITKDLWDQHRKIEAMFTRLVKGDQAFNATVYAPVNNDLLEIVCDEIEIHSAIEEEIVYPMLAQVDSRRAEASQDEHDEIKEIIAQIQEIEGDDPEENKLARRLERLVNSHVVREERDVFPLLKARLYHEGFEMGRQAFAMRQEMLGQGNRMSLKEPPRLGWPGAGWN